MKFAREIINKYCDKKVGISVSGGADSMCLLDLFLNSNHNKDNIVVINFDHSLRGAESENDSKFVADYCTSKGLKLYFAKFDINELSSKSHQGHEYTARLCRKQEYEKLLSSGFVDNIFLAHNLDDHTESVLMHIFRGCGIGGLIGPSAEDGYIVRPLIATNKSDILTYVSSRGVPYVTDSTNVCTDYDRNFIRNDIVPLIKTRWFGLDKNISQLSNIASQANDVLMDNDVSLELDSAVINLNNLHSWSIMTACNKLGIKADTYKKHIDSVLELVNSQVGSSINLPNKLIAVREYDAIRLYVNNSQNTCDDCENMDIFSAVEAKVVKGKLIIDYDKLPKNVVLRKRADGDKFKPCNGRTKLLSDYLSDKKIPLFKRDKLLVLACENTIYAIIGMEISDEVKLTTQTINAKEIIYKG